ncbi:MAG: hypothetical protein WAU34_12065 [Desulfobacterales bacterium]
MTHDAEYEPIMTAMTPVFPAFAYFSACVLSTDRAGGGLDDAGAADK